MKNFEQIYSEIQNQNNSELKSAWIETKKEKIKVNKISLIGGILIFIIYFYCIYNNVSLISNKFNIFMILFSLLPLIVIEVFTFIIIDFIFSKKSTSYNNIYKNTVINKLINNFYNNVEYFPNKQMPEYVYNEGKYDYFETYNEYSSEDYFEALLQNKYGIQIAEVHTEKEETYVNEDGERQTEVVTVFHGLFAKVLMNKSINNTLRISQNGNAFLQKNQLKMDSSEFEKYFDVQISDKILGMRILTADIMQELIEFRNKTKIAYDIYIENEKLYLRFHLGDMFEPLNFKKGPIEKKELEKYFNALNFTYNLSIKILNVINDIEL